MADGVTIAENADRGDAVWDICAVCTANRRLDDRRLCCECSTDPLKVEIVSLRDEVVCLKAERHVADVAVRQKGSSRDARRDEVLTALRDRLAELQQLADSSSRAEHEIRREVGRLERANERALARNRDLRKKLRELQPLRDAHFALGMTEAEYLALVSVMVDVVADDPDIPTLSIHRKLTEAPAS